MIISGAARLAGVIGHPVAHSLSPRLHGYWLDRYGIDGAYVPLSVSPDRFAAALRLLPDLGFAGVNVTVPHKEAAFAAVDRADPVAVRIGAVNTVVVKDGEILGGNSDAYGFIENLRAGAPDWRADLGPAVVLGAGGAARAVVVALADAGAPDIRVVNRTVARAERLAADIGGPVTARPWTERAATLADAALLVNATSLGMAGADALDIDIAPLPVAALVNDIVYAPLDTALLAAARRRGNPTVDGIGMLLHQARPGFAAWFGVDAEVDDGLRRFVLDAPR